MACAVTLVISRKHVGLLWKGLVKRIVTNIDGFSALWLFPI